MEDIVCGHPQNLKSIQVHHTGEGITFQNNSSFFFALMSFLDGSHCEYKPGSYRDTAAQHEGPKGNYIITFLTDST